MRGLVWFVAVALAGCIDDDLVVCADGTACPGGQTCVPGGCATDDELTACAGHADGDPCELHTGTGRCASGACRVAACGDGSVDVPEQCDGTDLGAATCAGQGYYGGQLACNADCTFDESSCTGRCGDGEQNGGESCDGVVATSCFELGLSAGRPQCTSCTIDIAPCTRYGWRTSFIIDQAFDAGTRVGDALFAMSGFTMYRYAPGAPVQKWELVFQGGLSRAVTGTSSSDIYMIGSRESLHFDGTNWTSLDAICGLDLYDGGFAVSPTVVYLSGSGQGVGPLVKGSGTTWESLADQPAYSLRSLVANAAGEIWGLAMGEVHYYDGNAWSTLGSLPPLNDIAISDGVVVAVGDNSTALQWVNGAFEPMLTPPGFALTHVFDIGGGRFIASAGLNALLEWDGRMWAVLHPPSTTDTNPAVAARLDAMGRITLAGGYRFYRSDVRTSDDVIPNGEAPIWVGSDALWHVNPLTGSLGRNGVDLGGTGVSVAWGAGGTDETVFVSHLTGMGQCTAQGCQFDNLGTSFSAVHGTSDADVWAVGNDVRHWDGDSWDLVDTGDTGYIAVHAVSPTDVYVTNDASVVHFNGSTWTSMAPGGSGFRSLVAFPGNIVMVGGGSGIYEFDGTTWRKTYDAPVTDLAGTSPSSVYAISDQRTFRRDADGWFEIEGGDIGGTPLRVQVIDGALWVLTQTRASRLAPAP